MKRLTVYVVPGSAPRYATLYKDKNKAEQAMFFDSSAPTEEVLIYDENKHNINTLFSDNSFVRAYQAYNGNHTDWYLSELEAMRACSGSKHPWMYYEAFLKN